jgi:hypothetical protein
MSDAKLRIIRGRKVTQTIDLNKRNMGAAFKLMMEALDSGKLLRYDLVFAPQVIRKARVVR